MVGLKISHAKASKILDALEERGVISKVDPVTKRREFL
jgi:ribosomal protein S25